MRTIRVCHLACIFSLALTISGLADDKENGKSGKGTGEKTASNEAKKTAPDKEPFVNVKVAITAEEREVIQNYVTTVSTPAKPGKKAKKLPPGLAKKVARGGELPPGWQKKCVPGAIM